MSNTTLKKNRSESYTPEAEVVKAGKLDRRQFLTATGGLLLGVTLESVTRLSLAQGGAPPPIPAWVRIGADESVTILMGGGEMGQGIWSGLAQAVAEELKVDWNRIKLESVAPDQAWITGGSSGIRFYLGKMRVVGATAREMLIAAAAKTWNVSPTLCKATQGTVVNTVTSASLTYGALAPLAATMPVPAHPPLTPIAEFKYIGKSMPRLDLPAKTDGSAQFGIDTHLPGMLFAVVKHCPVLGGTLKSTPAVPPGASAVVPLDNAVAVVASNTWQAMQAAAELQVSWNIPSSASSVDSGVFLTQAKQLMTNGTSVIAEQVGDVAGAFGRAAKVVDATYYLPYLAHAYMEVLNCTVNLTATKCEIWAPTQAPGWVLGTASAITGMPASKITVHTTLMGGGLGRKIEQDYISQAVRVAKALGKPVKLTWPREQDMAHDQYRPMALVNVKAALDTNGAIIGWNNRIVSPSILFQRGWINGTAEDSQSTDGATALVYGFGSRLVDYVRHPAPVPVGFWRSVGHSINAFAVESALDEVALATNTDPLTLRQRLLTGSSDPLAPRSLAVLNAAATLGGWGTPVLPGRARGIAFSAAFDSLVAEVAEISQPAAGTIQVHKVACVIDCGATVNPDSVKAQMQGGVLHGLSAALWGEVTFKGGKANVRNFSNYRVLRMHEAPVVNVKMLNSLAKLGGAGEPGVPAIAPAVANAYARLTGTRVRNLPFFPGSGMGDG